MFDRSKAKPIGTKLGASVVFSRAEVARGDSYIQHAIRNSAMGVVDEIARKYAQRITSSRDGDLLGVEYRLNVTVLTSDELDELFGQAYSAGVEAGAKYGMTTWRPTDEA